MDEFHAEARERCGKRRDAEMRPLQEVGEELGKMLETGRKTGFFLRKTRENCGKFGEKLER